MIYGLYIHFPFCVHKCFYCDFYSLENLSLIEIFVESLLIEIDLQTINLPSKPKIDTIYLGGGTPSLLTPQLMEKIFAKIYDKFEIIENAEITIECNPGTTDIAYLKNYKSLGANRISFGVQSFIPAELKFLERIHSVDEVYKAYNLARKTGFDNISIDLIFSLPNQSFDNWKFSLAQAISLQPNHISAYSLIYEENTPLFNSYKKGKIAKNNSDLDADFYNITTEMLGLAGFNQYEVSNYCLPGQFSRHNCKYWNSSEFFAFGPSAVGVIDDVRYKNFSSLSKYNKSIKSNLRPIEYTEQLTEEIRLFERVFLTLRAQGLDVNTFKNEFGIDILHICKELFVLFIQNNFMTIENGFIKLTADGYFIGDDITLKIMDKIENSDYSCRNANAGDVRDIL